MGIAQQMEALSSQMAEIRSAYELVTGKDGAGLSISSIANGLSSAIIDASFDALTWTQMDSITKLLNDGLISPADLSKFVEQERVCQTLASTETPVVVIGVAHDDLSDGSGKAAFTIMPTLLASPSFAFDDSTEYPTGWDSSTLREEMNNESGEVFSAFDPDIQSVIKSVDKTTFRYASSSSSSSIVTSDKVWALSASEISTSSSEAPKKEGSTYEYWSSRQANAYRRFKLSTGSYQAWSLRTLYSGTSKRYIDSSGGFAFGSLAGTTKIVPCFCV